MLMCTFEVCGCPMCSISQTKGVISELPLWKSSLGQGL